MKKFILSAGYEARAQRDDYGEEGGNTGGAGTRANSRRGAAGKGGK